MSSNKASISFRKVAIRSAIAIAAWGLTSLPARADSSCTPLVNNIYNALNTYGGSYTFEMTMHRTGVKLVTYSDGAVRASGIPVWLLRGSSNQLFSDRTSGTQPFNINAADSLTVSFSASGRLRIFYSPWNFTTTWDMSCQGNVMTKNVPGHGVVTVTFRDHVAPIL